MNKFQTWLGALGARFNALTALKFPSNQWTWAWPTRSDKLNYGSVGNGSGNSAVVACVAWTARTFPEAPLMVERRNADGEWEDVPDHALPLLLERPNKAYSGVHLWHATIADRLLDGNSYWLKRRSGTGKPLELWWLPSWTVEPKRRDGTEDFISYYEYKPNGVDVLTYEPSEIVHFRDGFDADNPMKGRSPLKAALSEVFTDDEAARFSAAILANLGVPGVMIAPKAGMPDLSFDQAEGLKTNFMQKFGGDKRGEPMVMQSPMDVSVLSFTPEQMNLRDMRQLPEERICAVLGIPPMVVGLGAGLARSTFSNMAEAREAAYESNIIPTQRLLSADLNTQLLPDFGDTRRERIAFDLSEVRVLQADEDKLYTREALALRMGGQTVNEFRQAVGKATVKEGDVYLLPANVVVVPAKELGVPAPKPVAEPTLPPLPMLPPARAVAALPRADLKLLETKADDPVTEDWLAAIEALRERLDAPMLVAVATFLDAQVGRVVERWGGDAASLLPVAEADLLRAALDPWYRQVLTDLHVPTQVALGVSWGIEQPQVLAYLQEAGAQIVGIDAATREAIARVLADGRAAGLTPVQIQQALREDFAFSASRAETISRTELGSAANQAAMTHYEASGVVVGVRVFDGDFDPTCAAMNGRTFSLAEARGVPRLAHPRCRRSFAPLTDAAALQRSA